ncbi:MAG: arsenate reductase (glutaredoxin) [Halieaceae bacterium]|jgi:arsenate reductase|nr:arsenate reductase (glutaredoxin) [Halieaceae bacterium]
MILLHNPRCSKSRQALAILEERGCDFQIRLYLEEPLSKVELQEILGYLGMEPSELARKGEPAFKEGNLKAACEDQILEAMLVEPKLIERPILVVDGKAVVGRPPETVLELIS